MCARLGDACDKAVAASISEEALRVARRAGEASTLHSTALAYLLMSEPARARTCFEQALAIHRALGNRAEEAITLVDMSAAHSGLDNPAAAIADLEQALPILRSAGNTPTEVGALKMMVTICVASRDQDRALLCFERLLQIFRDAGDSTAERATLAEMANVQRALGDRGGPRLPHEHSMPIRPSPDAVPPEHSCPCGSGAPFLRCHGLDA
ncbi:tetratricopeptide repeat protein [Polyangium sorediatum]|uniref:tetratricopeptide repeat protein n=1 Tax=Polyangium sorediatum TaxID=889274 RepID=UPI00113CCA89